MACCGVLLGLVALSACSDDPTDKGVSGKGDVVVDSGADQDASIGDAAIEDTGAAKDSAQPTDTALEDTALSDTAVSDVAVSDTSADAGAEDVGPQDTGLGEVVDLDANPVACQSSKDCPLPSVPCQQRLCQAGQCTFVDAPDFLACNTGSACVTEAVCQKGKCAPTKLKNCDDGNLCTEDSCKISTGLCEYKATKNGFACSDGNKCTLTAECFAGVCIAQGFVACDDGDPCTADLCDPKTGKCLAKPASAGTACDDGNSCTSGDTCDDKGLCTGGNNTCKCSTTADCEIKEDGNPCNGTLYCDSTTGACEVNPATVVKCPDLSQGDCQVTACNPQSGKCEVKAAANGVACDDDNPCTVDDQCDQGQCKSVGNVCGCISDAECAGKNGGNLCLGTFFCDKSVAPFTCKPNASTAVVCPKGKDTYCAKNTCDPANGQCKMVFEPNKTVCEDGDTCTKGDYCLAGKCKKGTDTCACTQDSDCAKLEDGNLCNGTLYCNKASGQCDLNPATVVSCPSALDTFCTQNTCHAQTGKCVFQALNEGKACDDDNVCTSGEICSKGACGGGKNLCACKEDADCQDDGNLCNGTKFCNKALGMCQDNPKTVVTCPTVDDSLCAKNTCIAKTGKCQMLPTNNGLGCDADGNECTKDDVCNNGACQPGINVCQCQKDADCQPFEGDDLCSELYCDLKSKECKVNPGTAVVCSKVDDTTCAENICNPKTGKCAVTARNQGVSCDADGSPCTVGDSCDKGTCKAGANTCGCLSDADCKGKEDGNPCTGNLVCSKDNKCVVDPATVVTCQDGSDTTCVKNLCDATDGKCKMTPQNPKAPCGKGTLCTGVPLCDTAGKCIPGKKVDCDDGSPCTTDSCDDYKGCVYKPLTGGACDDGSVCTEKDVCVQGDCKGQNKPCLGGTACTEDSCHPLNGCQYKPKVGSCDDGNKCTDSESCVGTYCVGKPIACNDGNLCTTDSCNPNAGCVFTPNAFVCNDGDLCTKQDGCKGGKCVGLPLNVTVDCADGNPCTDESCNSVKGCLWVKTDKLCDDGDPCTTGDICAGGVCQKGTGAKCDDNNGCTADWCEPKSGDCVNLPHGATVACDDGDPCTLKDGCTGGACKGQEVNSCDDSDACTTDSCDPKKGCLHAAASGGTCDDGNKCTEGDTCAKGKCTGSAVKCTEGTACTVDSCHPLLGCVYTPTSELCDDGNPCTTKDQCEGGKCVGVAVSCDDKNACTDDSCSPKSGCVYTPNSASCDDSDLCTKNDACSGGKCVGLALQLTVDCDDGNFCTDDLCGKDTGCYHTKPTKPCVDDDLCTAGDTCKGGKCIGGTKSLCDDGNKCTLDSCDKGKCSFELPKLYYECDDGDPCTLLSRCENGQCYTPTGGKPNPKYNACPIPKGNNGYNQAANFKSWWKTCCGADGTCCASADDRCHQKDLVFVKACKNCATRLNAVSNFLKCNDNNPCTTDKCVTGKGCVYTPVNGEPLCTDGKPCTGESRCKDGSCTKTKDKVCDDNNPCTTDLCEQGKGCAAKVLPDGVVCEQGGAATCSTQGVCKAGTCEGATARPWQVATTGNLRQCTEFTPAGTGWLMIGKKQVDGVWVPAWQQARYNGTVLWERHLDHKAEGSFKDMSNDGAKGAFSAVGFTKESSAGGWEGLFARFDADHQLTNQRVLVGGAKDDQLYGIATTADGGHVLAGVTSSKGAGAKDGWLIKLDDKDQTAWEKTAGTVVDDTLYDVALRSDGGIIVVGNVGAYAGWIAHFDKDGKQLASKLNGDSKSNTWRFRRVQVWSDNQYIVTGNRLKTFDASLALNFTWNINNEVRDIVKRPKSGYGLLYTNTSRLLDHNKKTVWDAKAKPGDGEQVLAPDEDSLVTLTYNNCGLYRTDGFGNSVCSESKGCYLKKWADCQDTNACTYGETCTEGSCKKTDKVCNDKKICTSDKCDTTTGKCIYTPTDGAPCSTTDSECAIAGECNAGVCYNDNVVAWQKEFLPFYGCCGDNNNHSNEYQGTRLMAVAPRPDGRLFAAGPGYNRNNTNSLYGKLISGTAGADGKYDSISGSRYAFYDRGDDSNKNTQAVNYSVAGAASFKNLVSAGLSRYEWQKKQSNKWVHDKWVTMVRLNNGKGKSVQLGGEQTLPIDMEPINDFDAASLTQNRVNNKWATTVFYTRHGESSSPLGWDYQPKLLATATHQLSDEDKPVGLSPADDGQSVVVAGDGKYSGTWKHQVSRIGRDTKLQWSVSWDKEDSSVLKGIGWTQKGVILTGQKRVTVAGTNAYFVWLRRLTSTGALVWDKKIKPSTSTNNGWSVIPKPMGFAIGAHVGGKNTLLRFDNGGALIGERQFNVPTLQDWKALPDGFVAVGWKQKGYNSSWSGNKLKQYGFILRTDPFGNAPCSNVGKCMGKAFADCDDGNPCTGDSCDKDKGCFHFAVSEGVACADGDPCTDSSVCTNGKCAGGVPVANGSACDDGDVCTKDTKCNWDNKCVGRSSCDDGKPCTADSCDKDGKCTYKAVAKGGACDDGDYCTEDTTCDDQGACTGGKMVCKETVVVDEPFKCDGDHSRWQFKKFNASGSNVTWAVDKTPAAVQPKAADCTLNVNDGVNYNKPGATWEARNDNGRWTLPKYGQVHLSLWSYFDGDSAKETTHRLQARSGNGTRANWDFTKTAHENKKWVELKANLTGKTASGDLYFWAWLRPDSAGNTGAGWFLDALKVTHRTHPLGIPCSYDSQCQDHDQCTQDVCTKGRCTNSIATGIICQDGSACTVDDTCDAKGACQPGKSKVCTDGDVCTEDTCAPASGCVFPPAKDNTTCDDGSACTTGDGCQAGACLGKNKCDDGDPCTLNTCASDGSCSSAQLGDGVPCGSGATCQSGKCTVGATAGWGRSVSGGIVDGKGIAALRLNGEAWGWGYNFQYNVTDANQDDQVTPVKSQAYPGTIEQLAAGPYATCALVIESGVRQVYCVGYNYQGQLGAESSSARIKTPTLLRGSQHTRHLSMGVRNVCGVRTDGSVWCTGYGLYGVTGQGFKAKDSRLPLTIPGVSSAVAVSVGYYHACALKGDGTVWCWGYNTYAADGSGTKSSTVFAPKQIPGLSDIRQVASSILGTVVVRSDGKVYGWGGDRYGSLAQGSTSNSTTYIGVKQLQGLSGVVQVALAKYGGCARKSDGTVACWGVGNQGQIGNGANDHKGVATAVTGLSGAVDVACTEFSACALTSDGAAYCWGDNEDGELGDGKKPTDSNVPVLVSGTK